MNYEGYEPLDKEEENYSPPDQGIITSRVADISLLEEIKQLEKEKQELIQFTLDTYKNLFCEGSVMKTGFEDVLNKYTGKSIKELLK